MRKEIDNESFDGIPNNGTVWMRFQQDQAGAIEKVVGIAIVVLITTGALALIGAVVKDYVDEIPDASETETGLD